MSFSNILDIPESAHPVFKVSYTEALGKQVTEAQILERCAEIYAAHHQALDTSDDFFIQTTFTETSSGTPAHGVVYMTKLLTGPWMLIFLRSEADDAPARIGLCPESEEALLQLLEDEDPGRTGPPEGEGDGGAQTTIANTPAVSRLISHEEIKQIGNEVILDNWAGLQDPDATAIVKLPHPSIPGGILIFQAKRISSQRYLASCYLPEEAPLVFEQFEDIAKEVLGRVS